MRPYASNSDRSRRVAFRRFELPALFVGRTLAQVRFLVNTLSRPKAMNWALVSDTGLSVFGRLRSARPILQFPGGSGGFSPGVPKSHALPRWAASPAGSSSIRLPRTAFSSGRPRASPWSEAETGHLGCTRPGQSPAMQCRMSSSLGLGSVYGPYRLGCQCPLRHRRVLSRDSRPGLAQQDASRETLPAGLHPRVRRERIGGQHPTNSRTEARPARRAQRKAPPYRRHAVSQEILAVARLACGHPSGRRSDRAGCLRLSTSVDVLGRSCLCDRSHAG